MARSLKSWAKERSCSSARMEISISSMSSTKYCKDDCDTEDLNQQREPCGSRLDHIDWSAR
ncbi:hypothetical protein AKJ16_DCAP16584 [Drosera capensis]